MNPDFNTMAKIDYDYVIELSLFRISVLLVGAVIVIGLLYLYFRHKNSKTDSKDNSQHNYKLYE